MSFQELVVVENFELEWERIVIDVDSQVVHGKFSFPSKTDDALPMAINVQVGHLT